MNQFSEVEPIRAKDQILHLLKIRGPQTANRLAEQINVSPMAIRQHLQALKTKGWVTYAEERQPMGRPVKLWQLTTAAQQRFPDNHADLVVSLLQEIGQMFGEQEIQALLDGRTQTQVQNYAAQMTEQQDWRSRVAQLAALRSQDGYMAEVIEQPGDALLLVENHCSICQAAQTCPAFCRSELEVFTHLLGANVCIERTEHILAGDRRCAYRIAAS